MKTSMLLATLVATLGLAACDRPTVVNTPPTPVVVPGPAGPQGDSGKAGAPGTPGSAAVIVVPSTAASEPK